MNCGVYSITAPSGSCYIGSSKNIRARWAQHRVDLRRGAHHSEQLQRAFLKYGLDAFVFAPVLYCSESMLRHYEQTVMDAVHPEYNGSKIAVWHPGRPASDAAREKMRRDFSDETKKKLSDARRARPPASLETRTRISNSLAGMKKTHESIAKRRETDAMNPKVRSHKQSGLPVGVTKKGQKFWARATIDGRRVAVGVFATVEQAVIARATLLMGAK